MVSGGNAQRVDGVFWGERKAQASKMAGKRTDGGYIIVHSFAIKGVDGKFERKISTSHWQGGRGVVLQFAHIGARFVDTLLAVVVLEKSSGGSRIC